MKTERSRSRTTSLHITHFMRPDEVFLNCYNARNAVVWLESLQRSLFDKKNIESVIDHSENGMVALRHLSSKEKKE